MKLSPPQSRVYPGNASPWGFPLAEPSNGICRFMHLRWLAAIHDAGISCSGLVFADYGRKPVDFEREWRLLPEFQFAPACQTPYNLIDSWFQNNELVKSRLSDKSTVEGNGVLRVALVEDDAIQSELLEGWLNAAGYECHCFFESMAFQNEFKHRQYDLLVLDWELPGLSGVELTQWVRDSLSWRIPILFVTNRNSDQDIVRALETGADDFMTKPITREVLLARMSALARRSGLFPTEEGVMEVGAIRIDQQKRSIVVGDRTVTLSEKEYNLAVLFLNNVGRLLSRAHLLENVWGIHTDIPTRTIDTHISRLRQKLLLTPDNGWRLKGVYHHGYRLEQIPGETEIALSGG